MQKKFFRAIIIFFLVISGQSILAKDKHQKDMFFDPSDGRDDPMIIAVKRVENQMNGRVYRVHLEQKGKRLSIFEIHAMSNQTAVTVEADGRSGQIINATDDGFWANWTDIDVKKVASESKITMGKAIQIAQGQCSGKALKARIEYTDNTAIFSVSYVNPQEACITHVDPTSGKVIKVELKENKHHK